MVREKRSILSPDERFSIMVAVSADGSHRPFDIDDLYEMVRPLELPASVPQKIRTQFDLARNAFLYSWFVYELATLAEKQSYAVVEMAIRHRARTENVNLSPKAGLRKALDLALQKNWLRESDFAIVAAPHANMSGLDVLIRLRNNLAHGSMHLMPDASLEMMKLCHALIEALFDTAGNQPAPYAE